MSAELLRQKELETLHRQRLLGDPLGLHPGLPPDHPALRSLHEIPEGHPLREELNRRNAMLVLRHNSAPLLSLNHQGAPGSTAPTKEHGSRKSSRKGAHARGDPHEGPAKDPQGEGGRLLREGGLDPQDEEMKDSESEAEVGEDRPEGPAKADGHHHGAGSEQGQVKDAARPGEGGKDLGEGSGRLSAPCSSAGPSSPSHQAFAPGMGKSEAKYLPPGALPPFPAQTFPFGFPYSPYFHSGEFSTGTAPPFNLRIKIIMCFFYGDACLSVVCKPG